MSPDTIKDAVAAIERLSHGCNGDENAHAAEDSLRHDVLAAIAKGECKDPRACAAEALKTSELSFYRWFS